MGKEEAQEAIAGDIVALTGVGEANIGDTIATGDNPEALPTIELEPPTLSIYRAQVGIRQVRGQQGRYRQICRVRRHAGGPGP